MNPRTGRTMMVNAVTLGNALCGLLGCAALVTGRASFAHAIGLAAGCVFAGFVFDRIDGTLARRLGVDSPFGAQLDSLCDVLSFGLLPAVLLAAPALQGASSIEAVVRLAVAFFYLAAAIVRLARFTLAATNVPGVAPVVRMVIDGERFYHGLPSPAAAMAVASVVLLEVFGSYGAWLEASALRVLAGHGWFTVLVSVATALAMVRPWPYADPPGAFLSGRWPWPLFAALVALGVATGPFTAASLFVVIYLPSGPRGVRRLQPAGVHEKAL